MMIKCIKCGHENQLGSIFCHECGERIDMDQLSPEYMKDVNQAKKAKKARRDLIKNVVALVIFMILCAIVLGVLLPQGQQKFKRVDDAAIQEAKIKLAAVKVGQPGMEVPFTADELSGLWLGGLSTPYGMNAEDVFFSPNNVSFEIPKDKNVIRVYYYSTVLTQFDVTIIVECVPVKTGDPEYPVTFDCSYAKLGHIPFYFLQGKVANLIKCMVSSPDINNAFKAAKEVTVQDQQLIFKF